MAKGPTFSTITAAFASASKLNANNAETVTAFNNTLSRDGSTPNTMSSDIDMNSNDIINVSALDANTIILNGTAITVSGVVPAAVETHDLDTKTIVAATNINVDFNFVRTSGLLAVGDGGGALYKAVGAEPSHVLKVQSNDGQWWEGVVPFMTPEMFGAVGNGVTDDLTKLQDMFDCPVSDTIMLGAGKTYYYETNGESDNLTITRAISLYTNGSTFHHNAVGGSVNNAIVFRTTMGTEETWTETILAFAIVLNIVTSLAVGTRIFVELGEHPSDITVDHAFIWATITANSGTSITIDKPVPFTINGTSHSIYPVTPNEGTYIDVLRIVQEGGSNVTVTLKSVRDFQMDSLIIKDGTVGIGIVDGCENINIGSIGGTGRKNTASTSGRVVGSWGSKTIRIGTIDWMHPTYDSAAFFVEAGTTDFYVGQCNIKRILSQAGSTSIVKVFGDSEVHIGKLSLTSNQADRLLETSATSQLTVDHLIIDFVASGSSFFGIDNANKVTHLGTRYFDKVQLYKRTHINEDTTYDLEWFYGVPRRAYARIDDTTKIDSISIKYGDDTNLNLNSELVSGEWVDIYPNRVGGEKALARGTRFRLIINGKAGNAAVLETWVEYLRDPSVAELSELSPWDENRGEVTDTTDGSGDIVITHGLGGEPRVVHVQIQGTTDYNPTVHTKGATSFKVRVSDAAGAAVTSTAVTVSWSAAL